MPYLSIHRNEPYLAFPSSPSPPLPSALCPPLNLPSPLLPIPSHPVPPLPHRAPPHPTPPLLSPCPTLPHPAPLERFSISVMDADVTIGGIGSLKADLIGAVSFDATYVYFNHVSLT